MQNLTWHYQGLIQAAEKYGFTGDGFEYLRSPVWWCGTTMRMDIGLDTRGQGLIDQDYSRYRRIDEHRCLCIRSRCAGHTAWGVERTHRVSHPNSDSRIALITSLVP